jgi:hypothetical protein
VYTLRCARKRETRLYTVMRNSYCEPRITDLQMKSSTDLQMKSSTIPSHILMMTSQIFILMTSQVFRLTPSTLAVHTVHTNTDCFTSTKVQILTRACLHAAGENYKRDVHLSQVLNLLAFLVQRTNTNAKAAGRKCGQAECTAW